MNEKMELESKVFKAATIAIEEYEKKTGNKIDEMILEFLDASEGADKADWTLCNVNAMIDRG